MKNRIIKTCSAKKAERIGFITKENYNMEELKILNQEETPEETPEEETSEEGEEGESSVE